MNYHYEVARRKPESARYDEEPFYAAAFSGASLVAMQFGRTPGEAFQAAWEVVQEDRERQAVEVVPK